MRKNLTGGFCMLKEILIKNYKSINKELFFSMEADTNRVSEYPEHIIDLNDNKLLKVSSMYGPNGGGKTNLLEAIALVKTIIINTSVPTQYRIKNNTCVFSNSDTIEETIFFVTPSYEIGYKFEIKVSEIEQKAIDFNGNKVSYFGISVA